MSFKSAVSNHETFCLSLTLLLMLRRRHGNSTLYTSWMWYTQEKRLAGERRVATSWASLAKTTFSNRFELTSLAGKIELFFASSYAFDFVAFDNVASTLLLMSTVIESHPVFRLIYHISSYKCAVQASSLNLIFSLSLEWSLLSVLTLSLSLHHHYLDNITPDSQTFFCI